jgi:hypothetical protein
VNTRRNKPEPGVMLEMCYAPKPWTDLANIFKSSGWKVVTGDQAMIWQGIEVSVRAGYISMFWKLICANASSNKKFGSTAQKRSYPCKRL